MLLLLLHLTLTTGYLEILTPRDATPTSCARALASHLLARLKKDLPGAADVEICSQPYISKAALENILPLDIVTQVLSQYLSPIDTELASRHAKAITLSIDILEENSMLDC